MRTTLMALFCAVSLLFAASAQAQEASGNTCVGWGIGGATIGVVVGFYGTAGVNALVTGDDFFSLPLGATIAAEVVGLVGGPMLFCNLFDPEDSAIPKASFVTGFGSVGLAAGLGLGFLVGEALMPEEETDFVPLYVSLPMVLIAVAGAVGGGFLGHIVHDSVFDGGGDSDGAMKAGALGVGVPPVQGSPLGFQWQFQF